MRGSTEGSRKWPQRLLVMPSSFCRERGVTIGSERALDLGADFLASVDVLENDFLESGEVFVALSGGGGTSLRRLLKPWEVSSMKDINYKKI